MKTFLLGSALLLVAALSAPRSASAAIMLDIDTTRTSGTATNEPIVTQPGFTSLDATSNPEGASITIDGATLTLFGGLTATGSRNRAPNAAITGHPFEAVLRDFVFKDGDAAAVGLRIEGLAPGSYDVQSFHYDAGANITGTIQIEVRKQGVAGSTVIAHDAVPFSTEPYSYQFTVAEGDPAIELVFREDDALNRSRFNGIIIVPEPTALGGLAATAGLLALRRHRWQRR